MIQHCRAYREIAKRLIRTLPEFEDLRELGPRIAYLRSSKEKRKNYQTVFAECCKPDEKYAWCCPYDFFIIVYGPNVERFNDSQMETLIRHELHHVGVMYTDQGPEYFIRPHDVEEFWEIINNCGLHWSDTDAAGRKSEQQRESETRL